MYVKPKSPRLFEHHPGLDTMVPHGTVAASSARLPAFTLIPCSSFPAQQAAGLLVTRLAHIPPQPRSLQGATSLGVNAGSPHREALHHLPNLPRSLPGHLLPLSASLTQPLASLLFFKQSKHLQPQGLCTCCSHFLQHSSPVSGPHFS